MGASGERPRCRDLLAERCLVRHPVAHGRVCRVGQPVFDQSGALAHDTLPPTPILELRPKLHPLLASCVMRCLSANRDGRFESLEAFLYQIRKVEHEEE